VVHYTAFLASSPHAVTPDSPLVVAVRAASDWRKCNISRFPFVALTDTIYPWQEYRILGHVMVLQPNPNFACCLVCLFCISYTLTQVRQVITVLFDLIPSLIPVIHDSLTAATKPSPPIGWILKRTSPRGSHLGYSYYEVPSYVDGLDKYRSSKYRPAVIELPPPPLPLPHIILHITDSNHVMFPLIDVCCELNFNQLSSS
jgi:hypothetical protein